MLLTENLNSGVVLTVVGTSIIFILAYLKSIHTHEINTLIVFHDQSKAKVPECLKNTEN